MTQQMAKHPRPSYILETWVLGVHCTYLHFHTRGNNQAVVTCTTAF